MTASSTEFKESEKLSLYSFDYDGCCDQFGLLLLSSAWAEVAWVKELKAKFDKGYLISRILAEAQKHPVVLMNGSSRQDLITDTYNRFTQARDSESHIDSGSCFYFIVKLAEILKAKLPEALQENIQVDKFLLADLYNFLAEGRSFDLALDNAETRQMFHSKARHLSDLLQKYEADKTIPRNSKFDRSKISLIYAQIHKAAINNPEKLIEYNLYEDSGQICAALINAYSKHPELLPKNVVLNVHHYEPDSQKPELGPEKTTKIVGTAAEPDWNYISNVSLLYDELVRQGIAKNKGPYDPEKVDLAMGNFKKSRVLFSLRDKTKAYEAKESVRLFRQGDEKQNQDSPENAVRAIVRDEILKSLKKLS